MIKRAFDIVAAGCALLVLAPVIVFVAWQISRKMGSPVLFQQVRPGLNGKPFEMIKFRTMKDAMDASGNPLPDVERLTPFGQFLRSSSLDELPELWNVLKGDMSLVGPRPERQYYIDQIVKEAPHYRLLHKVKPGITSWGQVKYGYAENVEQMPDRDVAASASF